MVVKVVVRDLMFNVLKEVSVKMAPNILLIPLLYQSQTLPYPTLQENSVYGISSG